MLPCLAGTVLSARAETPTVMLKMLTEPASSFVVDGMVAGPATDKIREIMARTGVKASFEQVPWARAYAMAQRQADTCVYSTARTPERENLFRWIGPVASTEWVLYGLAGQAPKLKTLDDARHYTIGTYQGDVRDTFLRAKGFRVESVSDDVANPRKLMMKRIELWAASRRTAETILAPHGWADAVVPVLAFNKVELYLACNAALPGELAHRFGEALAAMRRDGTAKAIDDKYAHWPSR